MSSFNRADYHRVYRFARDTFNLNYKTFSKREVLVPEACRIMDLCEEVIGQQSDRPAKSRGWQHVSAA